MEGGKSGNGGGLLDPEPPPLRSPSAWMDVLEAWYLDGRGVKTRAYAHDFPPSYGICLGTSPNAL
jgi:hypothetical protein